MLYCPNFFWNVLQVWMTGKDVIYKWHEVDQTKHEIFVFICCNEIQVKVNLEITTFFFYLRFPYCPNFFWFGVVDNVRPLSCVSCVPASCFLIWLVSCPRFMSLLVNSVPGVCVWLWVYYHVYLSPVCWVPCHLVYSVFPVFLCVCITLSTLDVVIKDYYFEVYPRLRVPRFSLLCAPWQIDR